MQLPTEEAEAYTNVADSFTDGEHVHVQTYEGTHARRIARAATHPGPASPPFSHIRYVLHQLFNLLSARLSTLIVMLTFTCQVWAFKYTRSYAALRAADLDWIVGQGYSLGGYILEKKH